MQRGKLDILQAEQRLQGLQDFIILVHASFLIPVVHLQEVRGHYNDPSCAGQDTFHHTSQLATLQSFQLTSLLLEDVCVQRTGGVMAEELLTTRERARLRKSYGHRSATGS